MGESCIVCGWTDFRVHRVIDSHLVEIPDGLDRPEHVAVTTGRCRRCGLVRLEQPHHSPGDLERLYTEDSISYQASLSKLGERNHGSVYSTDEFAFMAARPGRLLDVGCSSGYLLARARERGWEVAGIDIDPRAVAVARQQLGLDVKCEPLSEASYPPNWFDVITLWGVLEHLPDPGSQLRLIRSFLKPGGEVVIAVPNLRSLNAAVSRLSHHGWDMLCEPGHLYHFNSRTLTRLMVQAGFKRVRWGTATIMIRGKIPFWPYRVRRLERWIYALYQRNWPARFLYGLSLKGLDRLKLGDILVATFVKA